jgi:ADP-L-glycero-D-manno-heptose 6-epimerase
MIIITGGAGFIGSALVWKFNRLGITDILVVDQKLKGSPKERNIFNYKYQEYLESDVFITCLEEGEWKGQIDAVFHMGACSSTTETDIDYLRANNSLFSERIADWCLKEKVYFAYASSAAAYGDGRRSYSDDDVISPDLKPLNPYGQSKLDFDLWVLKNNYANQFTGFRFFNVYGPNEYHKKDMRSMVHKGFEQIQSQGQLKLFKSYKKEYPDGGQKRDFVYVKDVVDVMIWFYRHPDKKGIFNVGSGRAETWNDLANALFDACGKPVRIEYFDMPDNIRNQYQYFTQADLGKLRRAGCPIVFQDLECGVADYVKNYLLQPRPYL